MPSVAVLPACALLAGVWAGIAWSQPIAHGAALVVGVASAAVVAWVARHGVIALMLALAGYGVAGATLGGHAAAHALAPSIRAVLGREVGGFTLVGIAPPRPHEPFTIRARLLEDAFPAEFGASMRVDLEAVEIAGVMRRVD